MVWLLRKGILFQICVRFLFETAEIARIRHYLVRRALVTRDLGLKPSACFTPQSFEVIHFRVLSSSFVAVSLLAFMAWNGDPHCLPPAYHLSRRSSAEAGEGEPSY